MPCTDYTEHKDTNTPHEYTHTHTHSKTHTLTHTHTAYVDMLGAEGEKLDRVSLVRQN